MSKFKRRLESNEAADARFMIDVEKKSIGQIARFFKVNKPSIKKALGIWEKHA